MDRIGRRPADSDDGQHLVLPAGTLDAQADDGALDHAGVAVDHRLHLVAGDVLAAPADAVVQPVHKMQPPRFIEPSCIAGVEPQVPPRRHGAFGHAVIAHVEAERHLGTHQDLAGLIGRNWQVGFGVGHDDVEEVGQRPPRAARHDRVVEAGVGDHVDLGHPVALHDPHAEPLFERCGPFRGHRQGDDGSQLMVTIAVGRRAAPDELGHDPEGIRQGDLVPPHRVEPLAGAEPLLHVDRGAGVERRKDLHEQAVRVEHRHAAVEAVLRCDLQALGGSEAEQVAVRLGHQHAFGGTGGARGVHDRADIAGFGRQHCLGTHLGLQQLFDGDLRRAHEHTAGTGAVVAVVDQDRGLNLGFGRVE